MSTGFKSAEETVRDLKFGETVADGNGNKYTKTIGGWIYQTFSGQVCFIQIHFHPLLFLLYLHFQYKYSPILPNISEVYCN